jgi:hypothetical protein
VDNTDEQNRVQQVVARTIDFKWLYEHVDVDALAQHFILLYSKEIDVVQITLLGDGILCQLADRFGLTFGNYNNRPLVIRELSKHYGTMSCTVFGYDEVKHVLPGYWTDDGAPDYENATADQRGMQGFWTNDDGEAAPGEETSKVSNYW